MTILNWLKTFSPEAPLRRVCNVVQMNRIANVLNNIEGVNCRIDKPTHAEGRNWKIIVDGTTDIAPDENTPGWVNPFTWSGGYLAKGPLEIKSVSGDKIQFWGSSILGAPDGKLALFKGAWHDIDDTDVPFETDFTVTGNTVFYVEGTMTLDVDYHTYSMAYAFKSAADAFPEPTPNTTEIIPCWYVPFAAGAITKADIVRWLSVVNVSGIS